jgi:hypothetical protein
MNSFRACSIFKEDDAISGRNGPAVALRQTGVRGAHTYVALRVLGSRRGPCLWTICRSPAVAGRRPEPAPSSFHCLDITACDFRFESSCWISTRVSTRSLHRGLNLNLSLESVSPPERQLAVVLKHAHKDARGNLELLGTLRDLIRIK